MRVKMAHVRWARALREEQHLHPLRMKKKSSEKLRRIEFKVESLGRSCARNEEFLNLVQRVRVCRTLDLWIGRVDKALVKLEARHRKFFTGRPTRTDPSLAFALTYFPNVINPLLDFEKQAPGVVLGRQLQKIADLMARHVVMVNPHFGLVEGAVC